MTQLMIGDIVIHNGKRYTLIEGFTPRRLHEPSVVGLDTHPDHDGYMDIDDAIDAGLEAVGEQS